MHSKLLDLYASETWPMKVENEKRMNTTEMLMVRKMCRVSLRDRRLNEKLRAHLHGCIWNRPAAS